MAEQLELYPSGLTRAQFASLSQYADRAKGLTPQELLQEAQHHLERAEAARGQNRLVNVRLAAGMTLDAALDEMLSASPASKETVIQ